MKRLITGHWKGIFPALLIGLALAFLQIVFGLATYHQSRNLLWEGKFQTSKNLTQGLIGAAIDPLILQDYAALEARILQTMSNRELASVLLTDASGKVLSHLERLPGAEPRLTFEPAVVETPHMQDEIVQSQDETFITTWGRVNVGQTVGWVRLQAYNELDDEDLVNLRRKTLLLSGLSILSGVAILGVFLWRVYFVSVRREQMFEVRLDEATQRLVQSEKLASLGEMAAGVAHEINNPVGYVSSNLNSLKKYLAIYDKVFDCPPEEVDALKQSLKFTHLRDDVNELLAETQKGVARVKTLVQNLKDYARTNAATHYVEADIQAGLQTTLNIAKAQLKDKAEVRLSLGKLPAVECVPAQIDQVLLNLIVNAAQAMPEGRHGLIEIRTGADAKSVWIEVEDNGAGIAEPILGKIFDPFFTTKDPGVGTGLGLSISHNIVQQHGGTLAVRSTVGVGTTFTVTLPIRHTNRRGKP